MNRTTERYLRSHGQWVKVTRNHAARTFTLARGWGGEVKAHAVQVYTFKYLPTWADAEALAAQHIADHA